VCLTIINVNDTLIEDPESYTVIINSTDEAVALIDNVVQVTIIDGNTGEYGIKASVILSQWNL
jgi:hypothetical protein